jgi:ABC-type multidrug transport system ATPase subunit
VLVVNDVSKSLGHRKVLDGISFVVQAGEVAVVLGENGAGKSTLLRVVSGILEADRGEVVVCGSSMRRQPVSAKARLGYVPDATDALPDLQVGEFVALVWALKRPAMGAAAPPTEAQISRFGLQSAWRQSVGSLSLGQRKRMCLLAATCGDPWLLVLDEPSNALDPQGAALVLEILHERRKLGQAAILSTNDALFASSVEGTEYRIADGKLAATRRE